MRGYSTCWRWVVLAVSALVWSFLPPVVLAQESDGEKLLNARCSACHQRLPDGGLNRVNQIRKTPEGWDMTLVRMMLVHGVEITADERHAVVKHLADTQGLAPEETEEWRYILERRPNFIESPQDETITVMCARCHSYARTALQRRDEADWLKHAHFHLGQWPTIEYQALGRDRNWWDIASTEVPKRLAELFPLNTDAWSQWLDREEADVSGDWRLVGHRPGKGRYEGTAKIAGTGDDSYSISIELTYADGSEVKGEGSAIVYTGFEWRGRLNQGDQDILQVFALSEDGNRMSGRWFLEESDAIGGDLQAVRADGGAEILSLEPPYLRSGETVSVSIHGVGLDGTVAFGDGVEILKTVSQDDQTVMVEARADAAAERGGRTVAVGDTRADGLFTVYGQVDSVRVEPPFGIARLGGQGGPLPSVPAQFDAVAYLNGPDGAPGTDDDVRIGVMPAQWSVDNLNETAAAMQDVKYAGAMEPDGLFLPAGAGPNPERPYSTNNVGELAVKAVVTDGDKQVEGSGHLVVTVQRWNDPPIR